MSPHSSSSVDVHALVALVEECRADPRGQCLPQATLEGLLSLVGAERIAVIEMDARSSRPSRQQQVSFDGAHESVEPLAADHPFVRHFPGWATAEYGRRTGDITTPLRWSDFYSLRELPNQPLWAEFFRFADFFRGLSLSLPALYPLERRLVLWRGRGPDFTDRDISVMALLRPHLHTLGCEVQRRQAGTAPLSPRQQQVLLLAAQGRSNAEIAKALFLSVGTVRKHLENAYARTGTHSRAEAALAAPATAPVTGSALRRTPRSLPRST